MATTISYIIPTHNRSAELSRTLDRLAALGPHDAEVIVVDNASVTRPHLPGRLTSGVPVSLIVRPSNDGAAARNAGARVAAGQWLVMLDDDSHPTCTADDLAGALERQPEIVGAVMADIRLPARQCREAGGLPEVFIGCGVAIRRGIFNALGGYDPTFGYYAEEYDLAARMLLDGLRIAFDPGFTVDHRKVTLGRDMDLIMHRLVRNNAWVMQRYAPEAVRRAEIRHLRDRYRGIAHKEHALAGFARGLGELRRTIAGQPRRPMTRAQFDRFTGLHAARQGLEAALGGRGTSVRSASIIEAGKNEQVIRHALQERGITVAHPHHPHHPHNADAPLHEQTVETDLRVIGTLSPGPMIDAALKSPQDVEDGLVVLPWTAARLAISGPRAPESHATRALPAA